MGNTRRFYLAVLIIGLLTDPSIGYTQQHTDIIAKGATLELISGQFSFTEGPAVDKAGNIFFTDQPNNKIWKYDTAGKLSLFIDEAGRSNGTHFDKKGNLITCADENGQLWSIDPRGKKKVLLKDFNGHRFNGPNDLWIDQGGGIYFTDPYFQREYWTRKKPDPGINGENLYYLPAGKTKAIVVDHDLGKPNGIVGSPDGKWLYVADMSKNTIFKYAINNRGSLLNRQPFAPETSDGMKLDERGNLYLTNNGVSVYDPTGKKIDHIDVPAKWTANLCFGGKNRDILFITACESVYIIHMNVKGVE